MAVENKLDELIKLTRDATRYNNRFKGDRPLILSYTYKDVKPQLIDGIPTGTPVKTEIFSYETHPEMWGYIDFIKIKTLDTGIARTELDYTLKIGSAYVPETANGEKIELNDLLNVEFTRGLYQFEPRTIISLSMTHYSNSTNIFKVGALIQGYYLVKRSESENIDKIPFSRDVDLISDEIGL